MGGGVGGLGEKCTPYFCYLKMIVQKEDCTAKEFQVLKVTI